MKNKISTEKKKEIVYNWLSDHLKDEFRNAKFMSQRFKFFNNYNFNFGVVLTSEYTKSGHLEVLTKTDKKGFIVLETFKEDQEI